MSKALIFSDVHLKVSVEDRPRHRRFIDFLHSFDPKEYTRIICLGDLFDFWFEYRHVVFSGYFEVLRAFADLRDAARRIQREYHCAALVKGGHLRRSREAVDVLYDGRRELLLAAPFVRGVATHGTGCTYSAAIAAHRARGLALPAAVQRSKTFITRAIATSYRIGKHTALNPLG